MKKETWITIGICSVFLVFAGLMYLHAGGGKMQKEGERWVTDESCVSLEQSAGEEDGLSDGKNGNCTVFICGAVKNPGVYSLEEGARVCDAVKAAGGFRKKALLDAVNQARLLMDGEQITIPTKAKKKKSTSSKESGLININQADMEELMTLSGIGESKAQMIIDYRKEKGLFTCIEDIMKISGIKEGVYNQIKKNITV